MYPQTRNMYKNSLKKPQKDMNCTLHLDHYSLNNSVLRLYHPDKW